MRPAYPLDGGDVRMIVQHDAAAAIDLEIDKAGSKNAAPRSDDLDVGRHGSRGNDALDLAATNDQRGIVVPCIAIEDARASQGKTAAHRVSVTLLRCGGTSGSRPRWRANASTKA